MNNSYIWYASYGSNLLEERFLCYIQGGTPVGAEKIYMGCRDNSLPIDKEEIYIKHELYFAKKSKTWNEGGVCFIDTHSDPKVLTLGKMYLITTEQFEDVVSQENGNQTKFLLNFEQAVINGSDIFKKNSWYGNLIYLGEQRNYPIFTFTNGENIHLTNKPSYDYLLTIIKGLKETYNLQSTEIVDYLYYKRGIVNNIQKNELESLVAECI